MEVTIRPSKRGWVKPSRAAEYAGVSRKVFYSWLRDGLRHSRLGNNRILVQFDAIDEYLEKFQNPEQETHSQDKIEQLTAGLKRKLQVKRRIKA